MSPDTDRAGLLATAVADGMASCEPRISTCTVSATVESALCARLGPVSVGAAEVQPDNVRVRNVTKLVVRESGWRFQNSRLVKDMVKLTATLIPGGVCLSSFQSQPLRCRRVTEPERPEAPVQPEPSCVWESLE